MKVVILCALSFIGGIALGVWLSPLFYGIVGLWNSKRPKIWQ